LIGGAFRKEGRFAIHGKTGGKPPVFFLSPLHDFADHREVAVAFEQVKTVSRRARMDRDVVEGLVHAGSELLQIALDAGGGATRSENPSRAGQVRRILPNAAP
jgi:hypothetical protein